MVTILKEAKIREIEDDDYGELLDRQDDDTIPEVLEEGTEAAEVTDGGADPDAYTERTEVPNILRSLPRICSANSRSKPLYSDCWLIGHPNELEIIESYAVPGGDVTVGISSDGQTEYNLTPEEYQYDDITNSMICRMIDDIRTAFLKGDEEPSRQNILSRARGWLTSRSDHIERMCSGDLGRMDSVLDRMSETVYRYTMGLGIFDLLLSDRRIEDIYIDAPCEKNRIHVTLNEVHGFNSHLRCRTNLIVDRREVQNLISCLKRESGLPFCESSPILETDIGGHDARATVIGYPMSPLGDAVAIRKHSVRPWTLARLVSNGTMDAWTAGLLSFMVDMRSTFLINGARGSGKTSLLSALMFEFPLSQRILTIEDTMELPCEKMRKMGYKIQSMLIDDRGEGDALTRSDEALRVSLRLGESAIILGEVRGDEARTLYQSMRAGKAGSSIMGTIHGDSARSVYERVVHDMGITPEAFMTTDIIVTVGTHRSRENADNIRTVTEIVSTSDRPGEFVPAFSGGRLSDDFLGSPVIRRIMNTSSMSRDDIISDISIRAGIRSFLASVSETSGKDYCGPEWISMSNEIVSKELKVGNTDPDSIVNAFIQWFGRYNGIHQ